MLQGYSLSQPQAAASCPSRNHRLLPALAKTCHWHFFLTRRASRGSLRLYCSLSTFLQRVPHCCKKVGPKAPSRGSWIRERMEHPRAKTEGECAGCYTLQPLRNRIFPSQIPVCRTFYHRTQKQQAIQSISLAAVIVENNDLHIVPAGRVKASVRDQGVSAVGAGVRA